MSDRRPDHPDGLRDPLPGRLEAWFDGEVRQAADDLLVTPLGSARARARTSARRQVAPVAAAILVVIVVAAGLTRLPEIVPGIRPSGSSATATVSGSVPPVASSPAETTDPTLVVEGRYPDGIPASLGGNHVARPSTVDRRPFNDQTFLLGGWSFDFSTLAYLCPELGMPPATFPCGTPFLAETPVMVRPRVLLHGWTPAIRPGPVVLEVKRVLNTEARICAGATMCPQEVSIERVVWSGDEVMAAAPRTAPDTFMRLVEADANLPQATLTPVSLNTPVITGGAHGRPVVIPSAGNASGDCRPPYPTEAWSIQGSWITTVLVFPTVAAREAVDQNFLSSGFIGATPDGGVCETITDGASLTTWVSVDNVMVAVQVPQSSLAPNLRPDAITAALKR